MTDVKRYLTEGDYEEGMTDGKPNGELWPTYRCLEALAACRALLEKHQWVDISGASYNECLECGQEVAVGHRHGCAIATALQGVGGE